jgi:hypothetical protein
MFSGIRKAACTTPRRRASKLCCLTAAVRRIWPALSFSSLTSRTSRHTCPSSSSAFPCRGRGIVWLLSVSTGARAAGALVVLFTGYW